MSKTKNGAALTATDYLLRRWSWTLLVVGAVASSAVNALYATRSGDNPYVHAVVPMLVLFLGLYAELIFMSTHPWWVRWLGGIGSAAGFGLALVMSYHAIRAVFGEELESVKGPLTDSLAAIPDGIMLVAATVLLSHRWRTSRTDAVTEGDRQPNRFKRLTGKALDKVEARLDKPAPEPVTVTERAVTAPVTVPEAGVHDGHTPEGLRSLPDRPTDRVPEAVTVTATDRHLTEARELIARTGKRQSVEKVARVLSELDDGTPVLTISETLGMGERTVREIRDARRGAVERLVLTAAV
ncbi:hypothetical protein [Mycobacteroides abscessus]|uniref:hypothetical protein n=2 Tax=Mycobacteroides abscessus TaxID=36809 RepID=UPI0010426CF7|nr:hypothetical protein [Mycobacteroides abscessus]